MTEKKISFFGLLTLAVQSVNKTSGYLTVSLIISFDAKE
jgi:hypothetical protein